MPVVSLVLPKRCPNNGFSGVSFRTSGTGWSDSDHLKIMVPCGLNTRKHSAKPWRSISRQSPVKCPYFFESNPLAPVRSM